MVTGLTVAPHLDVDVLGGALKLGHLVLLTYIVMRCLVTSGLSSYVEVSLARLVLR